MNLDMELLLDAMRQVESGGDDYAVSPKGAKGPYQFMDATAEQYGVKDPFNEPQARDGARRYMKDLIDQFGSVEMAVTAYNGGPGRLQKVGMANMPKESRDYLGKVMMEYASRISQTNGDTSNFQTTRTAPTSALEGLFPAGEMEYRRSNRNLFPANRENDALTASMLQPKPVNEAQRIYEMQLRTGLPVGLIERNLDEIEKKAKAEGFDAEAFRKESPLLAEWMVKNPVGASLAQGDYENLSFLEKAMSTFKAVPAGVEQGMLLERSMMLNYKAVEGTLSASEEMELGKIEMQLQELQRQNSKGLPSWFKEAGSIVGIQIPLALQAAKTGVQLGLPAGAAAGAVTGLIGGPGAPVTVTAGAAAGGVLGFKSFATASYLEQSYKMAVGEAYSDLKDAKDQFGEPIDPVAAKYAALLVGVPNAAMEFASLRMAIKVIPGVDKVIGKLSADAMKQILVKPTVAAALKDFGKNYAAAVGTETFTEGMQKLLVILSREIATGDMGEGVTGQDAKAIAEESVAAFKGSVVLGALASGPKVIGIYADIDKAAKNEQFMRDLGDATTSSKTFANSPKAFADYIAMLKENGPVKNVFIPVETWDALFKDQAPDAATEVFGSPEQYAEAKTIGGDLVIPLETYAEKLAGTQYHAAIIPNARLNPGEMTPTEAKEAQQLQPEIEAGLQLEMAEMIAKEAPLQEVYSDVYDKLLKSGASTQEANRDASIVRERVRARAERLGVDPAVLYAEEPITLQVEDPVIPEKLITYNQQLAEPAVPNAPRLPLEGGEINLPPATEQEAVTAAETIKNAQASFEEFGAFGATTHPVKGNMSGTPGVAVAGYPQRGVITEGAPTQADLEIFMRRNRDIFEADPNAALGVWVDQESGKGYIDIANVLPRDLAIEQGEYLGELAVWDLEAFEEIRLPIQRETGQGVLFQSAAPDSRELETSLYLEKTLKDQPPAVRRVLEQFIEKEGLKPETYKNWDGDVWMFALESSYPGTVSQRQHAAREYLKALGVTHLAKAQNGETAIAKIGKKFDAEPRAFFQSAFHGTPHKFDRFSLEHIGTGEGAQAFGWGLYFAGKKEIAEHYRNALTQRKGDDSVYDTTTVDGRPIGEYLLTFGDKADIPIGSLNLAADALERGASLDIASARLEAKRSNAVKATKSAAEHNAKIAQFSGAPVASPAALEASLGKIEELYGNAQKVIADLRSRKVVYTPPEQGQLYQVKIPDDDVLLKWDATYDQQPPVVQKAMDYIMAMPEFYGVMGYDMAHKDVFKKFWDGERWYFTMMEYFRSQAGGKGDRQASEFLKALGVKGHKYLDASARGKGGDSFNYVIYDDSTIDIEQKFYQAAFHGSPFKFDKFTLSHIGTGEGAQAFGYGLYFAGKRSIAEWYRENLIRRHGLDKPQTTLNSVPVGEYVSRIEREVSGSSDYMGTHKILVESVIKELGGVEGLRDKTKEMWNAAIRQIYKDNEQFLGNEELVYIDRHGNFTDLAGRPIEEIKEYRTQAANGNGKVMTTNDWAEEKMRPKLELVDSVYKRVVPLAWRIEELKPEYRQSEASKGQLYEVDIPGDSLLLQWDEPLDSQNEMVKEAVARLEEMDGFREYLIDQGSKDGKVPGSMSGHSVYYTIGDFFTQMSGSSSFRNNGDKMASNYLNSFGVKGLKYRDASSRGGKGDSFNYVIFDDEAIEILQTYYQAKRGFSVPTQHLIALLKDKDPSTFLHESGHLWLEELRRDALRDDAPEQLKNDWETIKAWSGATDDEISVDAHEMFARGIEAYVMEGNSPSFALREIFAQFKDWLTKIYKSFEMLDVQLTDEVREVMDRLIATDEIIKETRERGEYHRPLLDQSMMTEAEYNAYRDLNTEAKREAEDSFRAKVMKELKREKLQAWRDEKKSLAPKVRKEILEIPEYKANYWLWSGKLPDGTVIPDMVSHKLDKQALLDLGVDLKDFAFRYQENGLSPDMVADMFGFASGESMVRELVGLPSLQKTIDDEVNRRIREEHGGIIVEGTTAQEAAMEVQNTRQIDVFNMELRLLKRYGARREQTHPAYMKEIARKMVERKTLRELDPRIFEEAALKASQEAQDALLGQEFRSGTGRNLDAAFDAKQRQMLNVFLAKEAWEKRTEADKAVKKWKKFLGRSDQRLAKTHNMDMVNAVRAIASVHGIGGALETAAAYMAKLQKYDPDTYNDFKDIVEMASSDGRNVDDMTVADFAVLKDAIEGLWTMARRTKQIEIDGVKLERETVIGELNTRIGELVIPDRKRAGYDRAMTNWDKTKMAMLGARAMLRRVEHWVDAMDDGAPDGLFRKYIWQPISEAADQYRDQRRIMLEKYLEIAKQFPKESAKMGKIDATELGYEFKDKAELLGALLHTGNESSLQKLLRGRDWGAFDQNGELDSRRWDAFIERMWAQNVLTKADYDFVQSVWDLFEEIKPAAQKAHKEVYGYYFEEITHKQFHTPFGDYKGGYYPAKVDPFIVEDVAMRGEKEALEAQPSSFMFPSTGRGFAKQRQEMYAKPLRLDLGLIPQNMEAVLRFTYLQPRIKDTGRLVIDKNFRDHLSQLDSEIGAVMLVPWLQRSASQQVEQPSGPRLSQFDRFFHNLRTRSGMQMMAANVSVALQQFTGISLSALKVKPRYLAGALWHFTTSPKGYSDTIRATSTFMRNRTTTQLMDIQKGIDSIILNPSTYQKAKDFANQHAYFMQAGTQNVVDMVTWGGAYEQATAEGKNEKEAVRIADSAVRETQGTFAPEDISRFEAGPPHLRVFTMFYSYFNMAANLNVTEFTKALRKNGFEAGGRALYVYALGYMIPAVIADAIAQAVSGDLFDDDDDDGYLDNLLSTFFGGQAKMGTAMIPVIGPAIQLGINQFNDKWYDDRINTSPAVSSLEAFGRLPYDAYKLTTDEDARLKQPMKDLFTVIGVATGMPVAPLAKPLGYLSEIEQGNIESPDNLAEFARGLISGRAPK